MHALNGNLLSLFLMEIVSDALQEIEAHGSDLEALLTNVTRQQEADYQLLRDSPPPGFLKGFVQSNMAGEEDLPDILTKSPNVCHTARLPAETRHLGILTESNKTGFYDYDKGVSLASATASQNPDGVMRLVYDPNERQECAREFCSAEFFLRSGDNETLI